MPLHDCGTNSTESVDFPIYAKKLAETITKENLEYGIAICKTGIGMSIALNKMKGLTCAKVCSIKESYLSRLHNDANVLALSNNLPFWKVKKIVKAFLTTKPLTEEKYVRRRNQIKEYEND